MLVDFRGVTKAGNNVHCEIMIDGVIVAPNFNCTPKEFDKLIAILNAGAEALGNEGVTVSQT